MVRVVLAFALWAGVSSAAVPESPFRGLSPCGAFFAYPHTPAGKIPETVWRQFSVELRLLIHMVLEGRHTSLRADAPLRFQLLHGEYGEAERLVSVLQYRGFHSKRRFPLHRAPVFRMDAPGGSELEGSIEQLVAAFSDVMVQERAREYGLRSVDLAPSSQAHSEGIVVYDRSALSEERLGPTLEAVLDASPADAEIRSVLLLSTSDGPPADGGEVGMFSSVEEILTGLEDLGFTVARKEVMAYVDGGISVPLRGTAETHRAFLSLYWFAYARKLELDDLARVANLPETAVDSVHWALRRYLTVARPSQRVTIDFVTEDEAGAREMKDLLSALSLGGAVETAGRRSSFLSPSTSVANVTVATLLNVMTRNLLNGLPCRYTPPGLVRWYEKESGE